MMAYSAHTVNIKNNIADDSIELDSGFSDHVINNVVLPKT